MSSQRREIADPDGRVVVLDERIKGHLARRRPQMLEHIPAILDTVARPDAREDDLVPGRERFFRRNLNPGRWLRVVVDFNQSPAFVVTAFVEHHEPRRNP